MTYEISAEDENTISYFINWAKNLINGHVVAQKEPYGDECVVYKLDTKKESYFLKIKIDSTSSKECERLKWFQGKIPVPVVVGFTIKENSKALLTSALEGKNLALLSKEWSAEKVIDKLVYALHQFHKTNTQGWTFDKPDSEKVLVHGDACLPNFIFNDDSFSGFIDLADSRLTDPEVDLAAAIWSLQYNLGSGYGLKFLQKYGIKNATGELVEKLRLQYEEAQKAWGFIN